MKKEHTVRDYMTKKVISISPNMNIHHAIKILLKHKISGAPVVDEDSGLVGVLSRKDCLKVAFSASYHHDRGGNVSQYMSLDFMTIQPEISIIAVAELFLKNPYRQFPVMERGRLVGQISRHDVLKAIDELWQ